MGLSMCDGPKETVKYIRVNMWCMLDWIFSQNCRNSLPLHTADQLAGSTKPDELLAANASASSNQIEEYKQSLVVILHCLYTTTAWHF